MSDDIKEIVKEKYARAALRVVAVLAEHEKMRISALAERTPLRISALSRIPGRTRPTTRPSTWANAARPGSAMPGFAGLGDENLRKIAVFLEASKGEQSK